MSEIWRHVSLGSAATLQRGFDLPHRLRKLGTVPVITSSGFGETHSDSRVNGPGVVTGRYGTIGQVFVIEEAFWPLNTTLYVKDFHGNDPFYIAHLLRTIDFHSHSGKSGVPGVNRNDLHELIVQLPPIPEQRAIAAALADIDTLLAKLDTLIAKKRNIKQATMQQLLTGQTRLPGFSGEWEVKTIGELEKSGDVKLSRGKVISKRDIEKSPGTCPIYSSSVKNDGVFGRYGEYMFNEELITWSVDGGGHFFHRVKHRFSVTNVCGYMRLNVGKINYQFFAGQLQLLHGKLKFDYQDKAHPSVIRKAYSVAIPSMAEQIALALVSTDMDNELATLETRRDKTLALKQGMMQELLTGRIRLL